MVWKIIPHCILWCLWREHNARTFGGCELSIAELKLQFYHSLFDWLSATGLFSFSNWLDLIDFCSNWASLYSFLSIRPVYLVSFNKIITYQKKKKMKFFSFLFFESRVILLTLTMEKLFHQWLIVCVYIYIRQLCKTFLRIVWISD